ncbi:putative Phytocyanin domain, cupredoxin [Dioscorea sansibarensis]
MVVSSEEEYKSCNSSHPIFFSNNGRTEYKLERAGMFYFISGVLGHCEKGQKMMVKVMVRDGGDDDDQSPAKSPSNDTDSDYSTAVKLSSFSSSFSLFSRGSCFTDSDVVAAVVFFLSLPLF